MLKKFMAKLGVGSAKVDLVLKKQEASLGEVIEGEFRVEGGTVEQQVNHVGVDLNLKIRVKDRDFSKTISSIPITSSFTIHPNEKKILPFTYQLPLNLPVSRGGVSYHFATRLDIAAGIDNLDHDPIQVLPPQRFMNIIRAFEVLGFREKMDSGKFNGYSQEFEFFPTAVFRDQMKEVEFEAAIEEQGIRLLLEVDMVTLPFGLGEKELKREVFFDNEVLNDTQILSAALQETMEEMLRNPQAYPASRYPRYHGHAGHHRGGLAGAMGGFAAGMLGGMMLEDLLGAEEEMDFAGEEAEDEGGFDLFGGGDDEF